VQAKPAGARINSLCEMPSGKLTQLFIWPAPLVAHPADAIVGSGIMSCCVCVCV